MKPLHSTFSPVAPIVLALALLAPLPAGAASALRVPRDLVIGELSASTYDEAGTRVDFAILICRPDVRILAARAAVVNSATSDAGAEFVEVETAVGLGPILGRVFGPFLPRVSMWFDPDDRMSWIGQRMPLFAKGPTALVLRSGVTPANVLER